MQTYYPGEPWPDPHPPRIEGMQGWVKHETWKIEKFGSCTAQSGNIALKEREQGRSVVILFPGYLAAAVFEMGPPPDGVYLRFDSRESALRALRVDTLILVREEDMKPEAVLIAKEMIRTSKEPKIIHMPRG